MATISINVTVSDTHLLVLNKIATARRTSVSALLTSAAQQHAESLVASFRQDVLGRIPEILKKATEAEQADLLATFEEIDSR
jgi:hypothetical protein